VYSYNSIQFKSVICTDKYNIFEVVLSLGPFRVPIVGNLPWIGIEPLATLTEWRQKYGNVLGLRFGNFKYVCDIRKCK